MSRERNRNKGRRNAERNRNRLARREAARGVFAFIEIGFEVDGEGRMVDCVCAACSRCDHEATVYGPGSDEDVRRALIQLQVECPRKEGNTYTDDRDSDAFRRLVAEAKDEEEDTEP